MRAICAAVLLLGACATSGPPPDRLAGCWIAHGERARTMRWTPDAEHPGVLNGVLTFYETPPRSAHFTLEPRDDGWAFCAQEGDGAAPRCRVVAEGRHGSLEGGRVFIDAYRESLRISVVGEGPERVIFRGLRDGCD